MITSLPKKIYCKILFLASGLLAFAGLLQKVNAQAFTSGNIVVFTSSTSGSNTTGSIVELNTTIAGQSPISTHAIDGVTIPNELRFSGSASSTGYLSNSNDGTLLCFTGVNTTNTSANVNTLNPRAVGTFSSSGTFNLPTTYTGASGSQTRCATTLNNTTWYIGDQGGLYSNGTTAASPTGNYRGVKSFGGIVYAATSSSIGTISASTGGTFTALPGISTVTNGQDFYLVQSGSNGTAYDILYLVTNSTGSSNTAGAVLKYSLVSGSWVANGSYATAFAGFGLAAKKNGAGTDLFISTGAGALSANSVLKLNDAAGYNGAISITTANNVTLYTIASGSTIKGVAFTPIAAALPTVNLSVSANTASETAQTVVTVTATASLAVSGPQTVSLGVSGISITAGDYTLSNTTITIPDGSTTGSVTFTIVDDNIYEGTETAILTISTPSSGITLGATTSQNIVITDNDPPPTPSVNLSVSTNSASEAAATVVTVTATASSAVSGAQTVSLGVTGTGITSGDYSLSNTTITILDGSTTGTVTFTIIDDGIYEGTETATLTISAPSSGISLGSTTTQNIVITDNDPTPPVRITEYMYGGANGEFVEFTNVGNVPVDMTGWSFDDNTRTPGSQSLSAFGTVQPGESVILTENNAGTFRSAWGLCNGIKIIGGSTNNLGRDDEINLYDASGLLIDRLTYGDDISFPGTIRASGISGFVNASGLGVNDISQWSLSSVADAEASVTSSGGDVGSPGKSTRATVAYNSCIIIAGAPTIVINVAATTNYLDGGATSSPNSPYGVSGTISDPTDAAKFLGIDFTIGDDATPVDNLTVTVSSSNTTVVPLANLSLTGSSASRNLKITPGAVGYSSITVSVNDGTYTTSYVINYAASAASATPANTLWPTGISDASDAIALDDNYFATGDDELDVLNVYSRSASGLPLVSYNYSSNLNLPDLTKPEVDVEAATRSAVVTNRVYWLGSMSNGKDPFDNKPNRDRIFATTVTGTGAATSFSTVGYGVLRSAIIAWGDANGYNFTASAAAGVDSKSPSGFAAEGMVFGPDNTTLYIGMRAPLVPTTSRTKAVIAPILNFETWFNNGTPTGTPTFGSPIELDFGGRGIRDLIRLSNDTYVILAGDPGSTTIRGALYKWTGKATDAPVFVSSPASDALNMEGAMQINEGGKLSLSKLQIITDKGGDVLYNDGSAAKDLGDLNLRKFRIDNLQSLDLTLCVQTTGDTTATACNTFTWYDSTYTSTPSTAPTHLFTNAGGCDSVVTLHLIINQGSTGDTTVSTCNTFTWYGTTYTSTPSVAPTHTFTNATGCDSVVTLHLTINQFSTGDTTVRTCNTFTWYGNTYTSTPSVAPTHTFANATACDSVVTLHLTINHTNAGDTTVTTCNTFTWYGTTYTSTPSVEPTHTFINAGGCDSVVTLHLTINHSSTSSTNVTANNSYTWNGVAYTSSGTYTKTGLINAVGCDSTATLILTIISANKPPLITITSPANRATFNVSGTIALNAQASDSDGIIKKVEFYNYGNKFGEDSIAPYSFTASGVDPGTYLITAKATDDKGATTLSDTVHITVTSCSGSGNIFAEGFVNIPGSQVADITASPKYPDHPDITAYLNTFEYGPNFGQNYGGRVRGYICAPVTGNYTFYIAGDDQDGLWVSTDEDTAHKVLVAYNESHVNFRAYYTYPTQKSISIRLIKGGRYYIETLHKQGTGNDHLSVAWQIPGGVFEGPIPGSRLSPYSSGSSATSNQNFSIALENALSTGGLKVTATPNPSSNYFTIRTRSTFNQTISIKITDASGRIVERRLNVAPNGTIQLGNRLPGGIYFVEVIQGNQLQRLKLVKQ